MAFFRFAFSQNSGIIIILLFFLFVPQNVYPVFAASKLFLKSQNVLFRTTSSNLNRQSCEWETKKCFKTHFVKQRLCKGMIQWYCEMAMKRFVGLLSTLQSPAFSPMANKASSDFRRKPAFQTASSSPWSPTGWAWRGAREKRGGISTETSKGAAHG